MPVSPWIPSSLMIQGLLVDVLNDPTAFGFRTLEFPYFYRFHLFIGVRERERARAFGHEQGPGEREKRAPC